MNSYSVYGPGASRIQAGRLYGKGDCRYGGSHACHTRAGRRQARTVQGNGGRWIDHSRRPCPKKAALRSVMFASGWTPTRPADTLFTMPSPVDTSCRPSRLSHLRNWPCRGVSHYFIVLQGRTESCTGITNGGRRRLALRGSSDPITKTIS